MRPVKRCTHHPFTVCMVFASHGRAGDFARRTDDFSNFKNNNVRRGQDPALQIVVYGRFPRKPRAMAHPCREAYMPPLQTPGTAYTTQKPFALRSRFWPATAFGLCVGAAYRPCHIPIGRNGMECDLHAPPVAGPAWCIPRIVGAACMRPANIAAPPIAGPAWCLPRIVGRGLGPAAPMIFLNFIMCGGRNRPPYRAGQTGNQPQTPRGAHPCREACMPPLQTPDIASTTPGTGGGGRFTGRIHAAPTNRPGTAGKWQDRRLPQTATAGS